MTIRVLVVDDSAVMRALLQRKLDACADITVVGTAADAPHARRMMKALDPDVVTLDIEMPGMDGLSFLEKIMELRPTPVIIVSGATGPGATATVRAMQLGAVNCYAKAGVGRSLADDDGGVLADLVREAACVKLPAPRKARSPEELPAPSDSARTRRVSAKPHSRELTPAAISDQIPAAKPLPPRSKTDLSTLAPAPQGSAQTQLIVIGSSTGGVEALHLLLAQFPADCPPTMIVQHVNPCFTKAIAQSLDKSSPASVRVASAGDCVSRGEIVLAPGPDHHLMLASMSGKPAECALRRGEPVSGHCPSVDVLFHSVASNLGTGALGILLTGMGRDGADGMLALHKAGGRTLAQDEESCVVFGMPRAALAKGAVQKLLPLSRIAHEIFAPDKSVRLSRKEIRTP